MPGNRRGGLGSSSPSRPSKKDDDDDDSSGGLVFLHHGQSSSGSGHKAALTTAARAHASRRGHSKSSAATKKSFRFVAVQGDGSSTPASDRGHVGSLAAGDGSKAPPLSTSQPSVASTSATPISTSGRSTTGDHAMANVHHFHQQQFLRGHEQQQQQQNFIIIDSTRAIVAAAGDINPPRSLSADSWDPFDSLAVHNLSHSEQFMLHYALTTTWAKFGESQSGQQELAQSWIWATIESPAALFAQIAGAAAHYLTVPYSDGSTQRKAFTTSLQAKHKALKALQYELDRFHRQQEQQQLDKEQRHQQQRRMLTEDNNMSRQESPHSQRHHQHQAYEHGSPTGSSPSSAASPASTASIQGSYMTPSQAVQPVSANAAAAAGATDSMVLAILVLAVHDSIDLTPVPEPHPLAPLAMYRDMHIYGQMRMRDEHMTALYSLVEQKGGLPRMNQTVFGYVLPPADMLYNLRSGTAPRVPCHRQLLPMRDTPDWQPDPRAGLLLGMVGSRFSSLHCPHRILQVTSAPTTPGMFAPSYSPTTTTLMTVMVGLEEEVLGLLSVMAELTVAFDHYVRGERGAPRSLDFFVNNADLVAHRMMCLGSLLDEDGNIVEEEANSGKHGRHRSKGAAPGSRSDAYKQPTSSDTASKFADARSSSHKSGRKRKTKALPRHIILREISRRAAMVFQDMVIFPTPARTGVKLRQAAAMLPLLRALRPKGGVPLGAGNNHVYGRPPASTMDVRIDVSGQQGHAGYDYLLGEDLGRMHLRPPHHNEQTAGNDEWWDSQLEVAVKFDVDGGEVYDEGGMLRVAQLSPSPTPSPSQHNTALPGQSPQQQQQQHYQHHNIYQQQQYRAGEQTDGGPRPPTIPGEDDFLSWATLLGAIATRFTSLHDAYIEQLAADIDYREEELRFQAYHQQNPVVSNHLANPAMGPGHYAVQGLGAGTSSNYGSPEAREPTSISSEDVSAESWYECHTRMMRYLWLDSVCNEPGLVVWNEALVLRNWRRGAQPA